MKTTRRQFLSYTLGSSALVSISGALPPFLLQTAAAQDDASHQDNILVVVQLTGGNDGLNTVVPYTDDDYYAARPTLAIDRGAVLKIDNDVGLHPSMQACSELLDNGKLGIVQGVGYPQPNRSHFESMDIWHTCQRKEQVRSQGWLGRYLDQTSPADSTTVLALHLGADKQPLALAAQETRVPSVRSLERFRLQADRPLREAFDELVTAPRAEGPELLSFVQTSMASAIDVSRRIESARGNYRPAVRYPEHQLGQDLQMVAQLIDAQLGARIYYLELDGFDTHSQQADAHSALLDQFSAAVGALINDLAEHGHDRRVLVMSFSEFGRRVKQNASEGTDHGAAAPMFLAGGRVKAGLTGKHPSLTDLDDGDLKHHVDFRQVYATVLEDWLGCSSEAILGQRYARLPLIV